MRALKAGVIGVGYLGAFHAEKYAALPGVTLVGVADIDGERVSDVARRLGVRAETDYRALLSELDLVSIAVPAAGHFSVARDCLERGIHVLVEKPVACDLAHADELVAAARARGIVLQVGHLERFNPAIAALRGRIRAPLFIESHRLSPFSPRGTDVDVILDLMIHDLDIILSLDRSAVVELRASGASVLTDHVDIANARVEFASGCVANLTASRVSQEPLRKMRIFERNAYYSVDCMTRSARVYRRLDSSSGGAIEKQDLSYPTTDLLREEIKAFVAAAREGRIPPVSGEEGRRALALALEIGQVIRNGPAWPGRIQEKRNGSFTGR